MLETGTILEWNHPLRVINPLPVPIESSDKKSLVLDPRFVNMYLYNNKIKKLESGSVSKTFTNKGYLFKFDLKKGYHHIDLFVSHRVKGCKIFCIYCPAFWLILCTFVFKKVVHP